MKTVYYCDKCGSEDIEITTQEVEDRVPISNAKENMTFVDAVYRPTKYRYRCRNCGYTVEFEL